MKILAVVPPDEKSLEVASFQAYNRERGEYPKLGLLYVAAYLESTLGIRPKLIDCPAERLGYVELAEFMRRERPDLIAMSVLTFNILDVLEVARLARSLDPRPRICLGGVHVNLYPLETLSLPDVDFIVHGEGERSFAALVSALAERRDLKEARIPGVGFKENGRTILNGETDRIPDLDELPLPARHLLDMSKYSHVMSKGLHFTTIQASRGCPYACTFCDIRRTKFRSRSPQHVVAEIESLVEQGIDDVFFVDDTITTQKNLVVGICDAIVQRGLKVNFKISSRVDHVDDDILAKLARAGCYRIHFGVETGTQRLLDYLEKGVTLETIRKAFARTRAHGIQGFAYMMIGIPTETREEIHQSVDFAIELAADYAQFGICTPYPKTELYKRLLADGTIPVDVWQAFAESPTTDFHVRFWNPLFDEAELRALQSEAHSRFYGRPAYVLRKALEVRSWHEFHAKLRLAGRMLRALRQPRPTVASRTAS